MIFLTQRKDIFSLVILESLMTDLQACALRMFWCAGGRSGTGNGGLQKKKKAVNCKDEQVLIM